MPKYRKKPVIIEAFQWLKDANPIWWRKRTDLSINVSTRSVFIPTLEGTCEHCGHTEKGSGHEAKPGDFIIQGVKGEIYPCKPDIFEMTYEEVEVTDNA